MAFFDSDGKFDEQAWHDFWSAKFAAPSQPGYAVLVRESIVALQVLSKTLLSTAEANGATGDNSAADHASQSIALLNTYSAIAAATNDGENLRMLVTAPMLESPNSPLFKISLAMRTLVAFRPLRDWLTIFDDEIATPIANAAKKGAEALESHIFWKLLPVAIGAAVVLILIKKAGGAASL